ncbi:hypothetical protein SAMN02745823_03377 [Sporobacter termitidis DSM 10068]|uniref:SLH domain-containing protein n=1 Tax=Sporobacter termitidis DSM 10068 TaxID=1123282 RepID=A0A1M5Z8M8_9FIRM|nr:hypothetical protein [Sporobacter termitidis]SHI20562.1 hypothetical protein SAMN02745823_03377 [Sporobacter termitidis DSM 10068]
MGKFKKLLYLTGVFFLASALALSAGAEFAGSETGARTEARQADLDYLYTNLKERHPDIYANTPESAFLTRKAEIESRLDTDSNAAYILDLQSLVALIEDSHTQLSISSIAEESRFYPFALNWFDGQWILSAAETARQDLIGAQVTAINGLPMAQVLQRFSIISSADNQVKLRRDFRQSCNAEELYRYTGVVSGDAPLILTLRDSAGQEKDLALNATDSAGLNQLSVAKLSDARKSTPKTAQNSTYYSAMALDGNAYYIQYNKCAEDPELPMETFCARIQAALDAGRYQRVLVDLRNNGGGSDGVIVPLLMLLREELDTTGLQVTALVGEGTFSSGIINAVELQEMGCVLAGEATSGSVDHFGAVNVFQLPNSGLKAQVSSKYIALSGIFDAAAGKGVEPLIPDVVIPQTLKDYMDGRDTCVEKLLADPAGIKPENRASAPLTRSRFIAMLYDAAGSPKQTPEQLPFSDLFGIEWYLPALSWAKDSAVAAGTGSDAFSGARIMTWQEAAVFLVRTVQAINPAPEDMTGSTPPEALLAGAWDEEAIRSAWKWGLLPLNADFTVPPTRAQGEAMAEALHQAK